MSAEQLIDTIARVPSYIGIEPYLERVFGRTEYLALARTIVVFSLALWAFVVLTATNSLLLAYTFRKSPPRQLDKYLKTGHRLRRLGRRAKRTGYILLIGGFVIDLLLLVMNGRFATGPFAFGLLLFFGVTYPVYLITELYGRVFEGAATRNVSPEGKVIGKAR